MSPVTLAYLYGALSLGSAAITVFFLRYHRLARDELFLWFAAAFAAFGAHWTVLVFAGSSEHALAVYLIRLIAFLMLVIGILRKNRRASAPPAS